MAYGSYKHMELSLRNDAALYFPHRFVPSIFWDSAMAQGKERSTEKSLSVDLSEILENKKFKLYLTGFSKMGKCDFFLNSKCHGATPYFFSVREDNFISDQLNLGH